MGEINQYLFVYGTLFVKDNEFAAHLLANSRFYAQGKLRGKLYDVGEYPGLTLVPNDDYFVYGNIYFMPDPEATLKILDHYEGFGDNEAQPNEFVRQLATIESLGKLLTCWVYEYNLPVDDYPAILSGDYLDYMKS